MARAVIVFFVIFGATLAHAVDLNGRYVGKDGVITISRAPINGVFVVDIADKNSQCDMVMDMRFAKNRLYSEEFPVTLTFTKKGLVLDMPREDLGEDCINFGVNKPFKRE